jgi:hypothetical protein
LGGLGAGLVLGSGIALIFELRNKLMWTTEDVEFYLGVPTLALIPSIELAAETKKATGREYANGANRTQPAGPVLKAMNMYKQLFAPCVPSTEKGG